MSAHDVPSCLGKYTALCDSGSSNRYTFYPTLAPLEITYGLRAMMSYLGNICEPCQPHYGRCSWLLPSDESNLPTLANSHGSLLLTAAKPPPTVIRQNWRGQTAF